jgi:hypothetical protein
MGGYERWVDVEELFLKAFELGPNRLAWRTRPDLPDYKKCAKALQEVEDPKRSDHLGLFLKNGKYTRKLSEEGLKWCESYRSILAHLYGGGYVRSQSSSEAGRLISGVDRSEAFKHFLSTGKVSAEIWLIADALQCLPNSSRAVFMARLDGLQVAATHNGRTEIVEFVRLLRAHVEEEILS